MGTKRPYTKLYSDFNTLSLEMYDYKLYPISIGITKADSFDEVILFKVNLENIHYNLPDASKKMMREYYNYIYSLNDPKIFIFFRTLSVVEGYLLLDYLVKFDKNVDLDILDIDNLGYTIQLRFHDNDVKLILEILI